MLIVGELINTSRRQVQEAVTRRDAAYISELARRQANAGVDYIDVNAGTLVDDEENALVWLTKTVQSAVALPLCLDSANARAIEAALAVHRGQAIVNSVTLEKDRFEQMVPLARDSGAKLVALCMDERGIPADAAHRFEIANALVEKLVKAGLERQDIFLDPLVQPISTGTDNGLVVLDTIRYARTQIEGVRIICGLSNVSYGLPGRRLLNTAFLVATMTVGLDSVILDPLDRELMLFLAAARALLGRDEFCRDYLAAFREGRLQTSTATAAGGTDAVSGR